ncbi:PucR family transcriptional regulator [Streptosporangium sp. NPDC000396]|uniref:PucR family transcriptional regulator n=1 Tax=Streptosporangium sp. NPDC000396 TaxID=3366185 RepID=UPI0036C5667D
MSLARAVEQPLADIPREFADALRPYLRDMAEEMIGEIQASVPEYSRQSDAYARIVRHAVEEALTGFVNRAGDRGASRSRLLEVYRAVGGGEAAEGRALDSLQSALRICARVAWRRLAEESERLDLSRQRMCEIGEAILVYLDEIAAAAAEGYAEAQARVAGELELRRRRLLDLLVADPPADPRAVADLARSVRWTVPRTVACVALASRVQDELLRPSLPPDVLVDLGRPDPCLVVPDPDGPGRRGLLDALATDWIVAIGPAVGLGGAAVSLRLARDALALACRGVLDGSRSIRVANHLATLMIFQDEALIQIMGRTRLAPLRGLRPAQRDRLAETLLAWLQSGNATEVAARLHIHPQTVRYRLRQATELFADQLSTPGDRFELEVVLRARAAGLHTAPE